MLCKTDRRFTTGQTGQGAPRCTTRPVIRGFKTRKRQERGMHELYEANPERADWCVFGRKSDADRRGC